MAKGQAYLPRRLPPGVAPNVPESGPIGHEVRAQIRRLWRERWEAIVAAGEAFHSACYRDQGRHAALEHLEEAHRKLMRTLTAFTKSLLWKRENHGPDLLSEEEFAAVIARDEAFLGRRKRRVTQPPRPGKTSRGSGSGSRIRPAVEANGRTCSTPTRPSSA